MRAVHETEKVPPWPWVGVGRAGPRDAPLSGPRVVAMTLEDEMSIRS